MTAIAATFSDFRIVKGRKVAQMVFEIPIEQANAALAALGGVPQPGSEQWVGVAPLEPPAPRPEKPKTWDDLSYPQRAGIRCSDKAFQDWMDAPDAEACADAVREYCGVKSRSELAENELAAERWVELDVGFRNRFIR